MTEVCALIPAAGRGVRFGSAENKVFAPLLGRPLLGWTLAAVADCDAIDTIVLIGGDADLPRLREIGARFGDGKVRAVVPGGADRQASVAAGLAATTADWIVVHDAARPCVTPTILKTTVDAARETGGAATAAVPVTDTLVRAATGETVDRDGLMAIQTPQAFRRDLLERAHRTDGEPRGTDDAGLVRRLGAAVTLVAGSTENLKVTRAEDLALAEAILSGRRTGTTTPNFRIGHGFDVHPLAENRKMWLGGVEFPESPRGLLGHSDADALLHAVCDALLGAAGLGDIGKLFPPSEMAHKDRPSIEFLREVAAQLNTAGWRVGNVDVTVLAETPKIGPRADAMKRIIGDALGLPPDAVGIKATTNEGLGHIGRGEGIAVHAAALIYR